jgi:hypothetical protein
MCPFIYLYLCVRPLRFISVPHLAFSSCVLPSLLPPTVRDYDTDTQHIQKPTNPLPSTATAKSSTRLRVYDTASSSRSFFHLPCSPLLASSSSSFDPSFNANACHLICRAVGRTYRTLYFNCLLLIPQTQPLPLRIVLQGVNISVED